MTRGLLDDEDPDRLYVVTGGRSRADEETFDAVTLVVGSGRPDPGMQSEHVKILRLCREPISVVELSAELRLPVAVVRILLGDLLAARKITTRQPSGGGAPANAPSPELLEQVLVGLRNL